MEFEEEEHLACCGSRRFAPEMAKASPFSSLEEAIVAAEDIWFNKVDSMFGSKLSLLILRLDNLLPLLLLHFCPELSEWNARYKGKFGFMFLIYAFGRSTDEILAELKKHYLNRPIVEFEIAAGEQMKITELRFAKHVWTKTNACSTSDQYPEAVSKKAEAKLNGMSIIGGHLTTASESSVRETQQSPTRTCPPPTTHLLDVSRGSPGAGIEVRLEFLKGPQPCPIFGDLDMGGWVIQGSSVTNIDEWSGQLMRICDTVDPGIYRISFNTGKYCPGGFFPYVSIVFEIR